MAVNARLSKNPDVCDKSHKSFARDSMREDSSRQHGPDAVDSLDIAMRRVHTSAINSYMSASAVHWLPQRGQFPYLA
jgi:hypothetical protein